MDIRSFDLNLLRALDALLQTAGVSRAAERINLSQPAMSAALARLRELLDDPLLVRAGAAMRLTPAAESLRPRVRRILEDIEAALTGQAFDPLISDRSFRLAASDVAAWSLLRSVISALVTRAPRIAIEIFPLTDNIADRLANGEAELALGSPWQLRRCRDPIVLRDEPFQCVCRKDHPRLARKPGIRAFLSEAHILTSVNGRTPGVVDTALEAIGHTRRVAVTAPDFATALAIAAETDYILTVPRSVLETPAAHEGLRVFAPPLPIPVLRTSLARHISGCNDAGLNWLEEQIKISQI